MSCVKQHNYVISLTRETKRRKHIEQEFGRQNILFSFFDAETLQRYSSCGCVDILHKVGKEYEAMMKWKAL